MVLSFAELGKYEITANLHISLPDFRFLFAVSRDCTQFVANLRTTFLGHSLWARFELLLSWSRLEAGLGLWLGHFGTSLPFDYCELSECVHSVRPVFATAPPHDYSQFHCCPSSSTDPPTCVLPSLCSRLCEGQCIVAHLVFI